MCLRQEGNVKKKFLQSHSFPLLYFLTGKVATRGSRKAGHETMNGVDCLQGGVANIFPQVNLRRDVVIYRLNPRHQPIFFFLLPIGEEVLRVLQEILDVMTSYHHRMLREMTQKIMIAASHQRFLKILRMVMFLRVTETSYSLINTRNRKGIMTVLDHQTLKNMLFILKNKRKQSKNC